MQANPILGSTTLGYGATAVTSVLEFNLRRPILARREVLLAISYAIDRQFIVGVAPIKPDTWHVGWTAAG